MNSVIFSQPLVAPHLLQSRRLSPGRSRSCRQLSLSGKPFADDDLNTEPPNTNQMSGRKRKADDDGNVGDNDDRMSSSPSDSPAISARSSPHSSSLRSSKRVRTNVLGRALTLPRLLETLGPDDLRNLLKSICESHPDIGAEVVATAPRPSVSSALAVLGNYESSLRASFPFGGRPNSDYAYNRVRQPLSNLLEALKDFTPHFLPPNEPQPATSLSYLEGATQIIHRLPDWDSFQNNRHKQEAYEEIAKAWASVIQEGSKRGGGIQLQYGGWDQKLAKHHEISGGRLEEAMCALRTSLGWMGGNTAGAQGPSEPSNDQASIREQLLSGTYGANFPVRVGPW